VDACVALGGGATCIALAPGRGATSVALALGGGATCVALALGGDACVALGAGAITSAAFALSMSYSAPAGGGIE